jgi:GDP/UDP-N,N'-diacetylbacillosamine 2-epimerase (hydrolysing)
VLLAGLVAYHPDTINKGESTRQLGILTAALDEFPEIRLIITGANADTGGEESTRILKSYAEKRSNAVFVENLGHVRFLSSLSYVDFIIGNSSSGLLEAPSMKIGTINLGNRQYGRPRAISVLDVDFHQPAIEAAIRRVVSADFKNSLIHCKNPYGEAGASRKILNILEEINFNNMLPKPFYETRGKFRDGN